MASRCPKCGSDQILNDECLKCGVLVSKAHVTTTTSIKPISYVAPETAPVPEAEGMAKAWQAQTTSRIASIPVREKKVQYEKKILILVVIVLVAGLLFQGYRMLVHKASAYGGYYRNEIYIFTMKLPDYGWSHYQTGHLKKQELKEAHDAFYRGKDPDNPEVTLMIWTEGSKQMVPDRFDDEMANKMLEAIENEILKRMKAAGSQCEITESGRRIIGNNDGFVIHANLTKDQLFMKTIIYCGFNVSKAYTIQFLGSDEQMSKLYPEIERIIDSFTFDIRII